MIRTLSFAHVRHQDRWIVEQFLRENEKARALTMVDDPNVTEKNSMGYKLLCSIVYDLGKILGSRVLGGKHELYGYRLFFDRVVEQLMGAFPNVAKYQDAQVIGFKSLKMLVRSRLQQAFCKTKPRS